MSAQYFWCRLCGIDQGSAQTTYFEEKGEKVKMYWCEMCQKWRPVKMVASEPPQIEPKRR